LEKNVTAKIKQLIGIELLTTGFPEIFGT